jgi:hypothetical protein
MMYRKLAKLSSAALAVVPIALRCVAKCQEVDCFSVSEDPLQIIHVSDGYPSLRLLPLPSF